MTAHNADDYFKREEDRRWRESVDHQLVSLMTAQSVVNDRLDDLEEALSRQDKLVRGDPDRETAGFLERLHEVEALVAKLNGVVFQDATGKHGLVKEVEALTNRRQDRQFTWRNVTEVVIAIIMSGIFLHLWPEIKAIFIKAEKQEVIIKSGNQKYRLK